MRRFIMADSSGFDVLYRLSTNTVMDPSRRPDKLRAGNEWGVLRNVLEESGIDVIVAPSQSGFPDYVFIANAGLSLPWDNAVILSNFYHEERRGESFHHREFFEGLGLNVVKLRRGFFEGQGDAFFWGPKKLFVAYGIRTDYEGFKEVERAVHSFDSSVSVIPLPMRRVCIPSAWGPLTLYHRDMCLMPLLSRRSFLVYEPAFEKEALQELGRWGEIVPVTRKQAGFLVCNGIEISEDRAVVPWADIETRRLFDALGYKAIVAPLNQFLLAGGATQCLVFCLWDDEWVSRAFFRMET